jgi:hemoglobin
LFRNTLLAASLVLAACAGLKPGPSTLFDQLGGKRVLEAVASDLLDRVAASPDGSRAFANVRLPRVKRHLYSFLCVTADGPCTYRGADMVRVHRGLRITEREFANLVEIFRRTLEAHGVSTAARNELLRRLAPLRRDIVTAQILFALPGTPA